MAGTVFCGACLATFLRVKLISVSGAIAAHVPFFTPAVGSSCIVPPPKPVELLSVRVGCPEFTSLHWTKTGWNEANEC